MTMADLEQLLREYVPDSGVCVQERGRASVTLNLVGSNVLRHELAGKWSNEMRWDYRVGSYERGVCIVCQKKFEPTYGVSHFYCSKACKQKAYRQRKKQKAA